MDKYLEFKNAAELFSYLKKKKLKFKNGIPSYLKREEREIKIIRIFGNYKKINTTTSEIIKDVMFPYVVIYDTSNLENVKTYKLIENAEQL